MVCRGCWVEGGVDWWVNLCCGVVVCSVVGRRLVDQLCVGRGVGVVGVG